MNDNTENLTQAEAAPSDAHSESSPRLQTEDFTTAPELVAQLETLTSAVYEFCQTHNIPMLCYAAVSVENGEVKEMMSTQAYPTLERVPRLFAASSRLLRNGAILGPRSAEIITTVNKIIGEEIDKMDPIQKVLFALSKQ